MNRALAVLVCAAFLTLAVESTGLPHPLPPLLLGGAYTLLAVFGYRWVDQQQDRRRPIAVAYVVVALVLGYAMFGALPGVGATILLAALVAQTVRLLGLWVAAAVVAVVPLMHIGMDFAAGLRAGMGSLIAGVFAAMITALYEREQRALARLAVAHEQLRGYAEQAEQLAVTQERNRVARDIHDGLGHHLTVVQMQIQAARAVLDADPVRADTVLQQAQEQAVEALAEVRRSVGALRVARAVPPLPDALAALVAENSAAGVDTELEVDGAVRELAAETEESLYRAAQEGLTNVRKHSGATRARVLLDYRTATVRLEVRDDGRGVRDPGAPGFGLVGLRERAEHGGGSLVTLSEPGEGMTLRFEMPG